MPILQKKIHSDFTTVHNAFLRDKTFGINARGLLVTMLSMADGWNFSIKGLASILPDGEYRVASTLRELEKFGYLRRTRIYENGKVKDWEYSFSDEPIFLDSVEQENLDRENQDVGFQDVDFQDKGFQHVENRDDYKILNNQIPNNQISSDKSINQSNGFADDRIDEIDALEKYKTLIRNNIEYDWYVKNAEANPLGVFRLDHVDELIEIMLDVICSSKKTIRVNGEDKPREIIKAVFLKLKNEHIEYVLDSLENKAHDVSNPRAYSITVLYNSFQTANLDEYIQTEF